VASTRAIQQSNRFSAALGVRSQLNKLRTAFFQFVAAFQFGGSRQHASQLLLLFFGQVFSVFDQQPAATSEKLSGGFIGVFMDRSSGFGRGFIQVFHDMETIHYTFRIGQFLIDRFLVGIPHVGASELDDRTPLIPLFAQPFQQGFLSSNRLKHPKPVPIREPR
jgi:hypothetical protein